MNPLAANLIRTYVPIIVGAVVSYLVAHGIQVDPSTSAALIIAMTGIFTAAYYTIARVLEEKWPALGAILLMSNPAIAPAAEPWDDPHGDDPADWPPNDVKVAPHEPAPQQGSLADLVTQTRPDVAPPLPARKADTGAIPVYKPPPGR